MQLTLEQALSEAFTNDAEAPKDAPMPAPVFVNEPDVIGKQILHNHDQEDLV